MDKFDKFVCEDIDFFAKYSNVNLRISISNKVIDESMILKLFIFAQNIQNTSIISTYVRLLSLRGKLYHPHWHWIYDLSQSQLEMSIIYKFMYCFIYIDNN